MCLVGFWGFMSLIICLRANTITKTSVTIIDKLTSSPVLGFANPKLPYLLHAHASTSDLGATFYHQQDCEMRVTG